MEIRIQELLSYTDGERQLWQDWFSPMGAAPLHVSTGGERHKTVGDLIQHIFAVELRYVQRLKGDPLTPLSQIPKGNASELFEFGIDSRAAFKEFVAGVKDWKKIYEIKVLDYHMQGTYRKFIVNVLIHEIRHWAQVALLLRQAGYQELGDHDLVQSDAFQ